MTGTLAVAHWIAMRARATSAVSEVARAAAERLRSSSSPAIDDGGADTTHSYKTSEYSRQKRGNQALFPFLFLRMSRPRLHALQLGT